jgi:hypothetical protein
MGSFKFDYPGWVAPRYREMAANVHISKVLPTSTTEDINRSFDQARKELDKKFLQDLEDLCQIYEARTEEMNAITRLQFIIDNTPLSSTSRLLSKLSYNLETSEIRNRREDLHNLSHGYSRLLSSVHEVAREIGKYRVDDHNYGVDKIEHARLTTLLEKSSSKSLAEQLASESPFASAWLEKNDQEKPLALG